MVGGPGAGHGTIARVTLVLYAVLAIVVVGGLFLLASRLLPAGEQIAPPVRDEPIWSLPPERALVAEDVATVRLPVALRGYRFAETDLLLDRLTEELRLRDAEIARLRAGRTDPPEADPAVQPEVETDEPAVHPAGPAAQSVQPDGPAEPGEPDGPHGS